MCILETKNFKDFMGCVVKDMILKTLLNTPLYGTS